MIFLKISYAVLLPTFAGFLFISYFYSFDDEQSFLERLSLGFGLGIGITSFAMFLLGILGIEFNLLGVSLIPFSLIILFAYLIYKDNMPLRQVLRLRQPALANSFKHLSKMEKLLSLFFISWLVLRLFFIIHQSFIWPVHAPDSMMNWSLGAKFFFYEKGLALEDSNEFFFGRGYRTFLSYPLHLPLMQVWFSLCVGEFNDVFVKLWNVVFFISILCLIYSALKREVSLFAAILATFFLSSVPLLSYHSITAYADLPLSYYTLVSTIILGRYMNIAIGEKRNARKLLFILGAYIGLGMWTKLEGVFLVIAFSGTIVIFLLLKKLALRSLFAFIVPIFVIAIPWHTFLFANNIASERGEGFLKSGLHFEVLPVMWDQIMYSANFNIIFFFFFSTLLLSVKIVLGSNIKYLVTTLFFIMGLFLVTYITSGNYLYTMNLMAVNRNILIFIPMMYYIVTLIAAKNLNPIEKYQNGLSKRLL
ncbi:MAG: glycosyltransferase family 39 protein [Proteobacteria bacterium]|nr:glycosyltransferase family 39 protein [Pseudomonadota bacterium]